MENLPSWVIDFIHAAMNDDQGINQTAYDILSDNLADTEYAYVLNDVHATEGRYYYPVFDDCVNADREYSEVDPTIDD